LRRAAKNERPGRKKQRMLEPGKIVKREKKREGDGKSGAREKRVAD